MAGQREGEKRKNATVCLAAFAGPSADLSRPSGGRARARAASPSAEGRRWCVCAELSSCVCVHSLQSPFSGGAKNRAERGAKLDERLNLFHFSSAGRAGFSACQPVSQSKQEPGPKWLRASERASRGRRRSKRGGGSSTGRESLLFANAHPMTPCKT